MRIIIPIFLHGRLVSYVGRDVTGLSETPYKNSPEVVSVRHPKKTLYNIDNAGRSIVLVEGILDAWRIGNGAVATFGTKVTHEQLSVLRSKQPKRVFVLFDSDATDQAHKLSKELTAFVPVVEVLEIEHGDPDDLSEQEVNELRREIGI